MFSTPDLKDKYQKKVFQGFESMKSFGNRDSFFGQIKTIYLFIARCCDIFRRNYSLK